MINRRQFNQLVYEYNLRANMNQSAMKACVARRGDGDACIDYRHVIGYLVRKPGAFAQYRWRGHLFPAPEFQRAFEEMERHRDTAWAEREYLHLLKLAADIGEDRVGGALRDLLENPKAQISLAEVRSLLGCYDQMMRSVQQQPPLTTDLRAYDAMIGEEPEVCHEF